MLGDNCLLANELSGEVNPPLNLYPVMAYIFTCFLVANITSEILKVIYWR